MKNLFTVLFLFMISYAYSQGNLQYNQTLLLSTTNSGSVLLGTVPAGKVWKIEGFGTSADGYNECRFSFDGNNVAFRAGSVYIYNSAYTYAGETKNIWIPAGTPLHALSCASYRWVSIVEFNIVP
jgi:hypothetical protein